MAKFTVEGLVTYFANQKEKKQFRCSKPFQNAKPSFAVI